MDQFRLVDVTQQLFNHSARLAHDPAGLFGAVVDQAPGNLPAVPGNATDNLTPAELAVDGYDPDGQQALALSGQYAAGAIIQHQAAVRTFVPCQPLLARGQRRALDTEQGSNLFIPRNF